MIPTLVALALGGSLVGPAEILAPPSTSQEIDWAIAWSVEGPGAEPPSAAQRAELRAALAAHEERPVETVVDEVHELARRVAAYAQPVATRARVVGVRAALDRADAGYRGGDFALARAEAAAVLDQLHRQPGLPGAVASAREAHLLLAKIAWAEGDPVQAEAALGEALRIDPSASLSTSAAAPALVERYVAVQDLLEAERGGWRAPAIELAGAEALVEIDGVPGLRPVPPGHHFVVVHQLGAEPVARWHERDEPWTVAPARQRVAPDLPSALAGICELLELEGIVLAERRGDRLAVELHVCGRGSKALWVGEEGSLSGAVDAVFAGPTTAEPAQIFGPWPERIHVDLGLIETPVEPRPWYRKGWIWGTSVGAAVAISGAVAAGVLLGGRGGGRVEVDATPFIGSP